MSRRRHRQLLLLPFCCCSHFCKVKVPRRNNVLPNDVNKAPKAFLGLCPYVCFFFSSLPLPSSLCHASALALAFPFYVLPLPFPALATAKDLEHKLSSDIDFVRFANSFGLTHVTCEWGRSWAFNVFIWMGVQIWFNLERHRILEKTFSLSNMIPCMFKIYYLNRYIAYRVSRSNSLSMHIHINTYIQRHVKLLSWCIHLMPWYTPVRLTTRNFPHNHFQFVF